MIFALTYFRRPGWRYGIAALFAKIALLMVGLSVVWCVGISLFIFRLQKECLRWGVDDGTVVYTTDQQVRASLNTLKGYHITDRATGLDAPDCWLRYCYYRFASSSSSRTAPLFIGAVHSATFGDKLVAITTDDSGTLYRFVVTPRYLYFFPFLHDSLIVRVNLESAFNDRITYYKGYSDTKDQNIFYIPFESDGGRGRLVGTFNANGMIELRARN